VPEELRAGSAPPAKPPAPSLDNLFGQAARLGELGQLIRSGNKIGAIKLYRELFGVGLKEAKDAVERLEQGKSIEVMHQSGGAYRNVQIDPAQFPPVPTSFQSPYAPRPSSCLKPLLIVVFIFLLIGGLITFIISFTVSRIRDAVISHAPGSNSKPNTGTSSGFASVALEFGSEGIGAGQFKDARSIGVDGAGRIYVGEYMGGRVQVFDAQGKFVNEWTVDPRLPLRGMAVDRKGTVYVVQKGVITRYEGTSGKSLGTLSYSGGAGFDDVAVTQDGGVIAATSGASDDIVRFNSNGQAVQTIRKAISSQTERSELNTRLAVDGLGNIYALGSFNNAIFKFTREGRFITRIGSTGNEPGQFRALSALAVDGQGRIFVSDTKGIQVFDTDGRYLDVFKVPNNVGFGLVFNDRNELLTVSRNKVFKFTINKTK
jgi:DNA-binding beta-propeller fold protein YncE